MSKEVAIILLGVLVVVVRTMLGVPGSWQTVIFIAAGAAIAILGFLLRGESIARSSTTGERKKNGTYSFVESLPDLPTDTSARANDHKEGITSLN